ncbi:MAG: hypothetical protein Q4B14_05835 [Clostridia bacterium]|nr:hypothetical protein [Clostridia bacterium]
MIRLNSLNFPLDYSESDLLNKIAKTLHINIKEIKNFKLVKRSIDSRKKDNIRFVLSVDVSLKNEKKFIPLIKKSKNISFSSEYKYKINKTNRIYNNPVVVGFGPAGMFAGLILSLKGLNPIIIERGKPIEDRVSDVNILQKNRILNTESNIQFGEGGAGAFSDGKLNTGINDVRIRYVLEKLVSFGAPDEILFDAKPHIGTDILRKVVKNCRKEIIKLGGKFMFNTKLIDFNLTDGKISSVTVKQQNNTTQIIDTDTLILAIGHSARDTFEMLYQKSVVLEQKPFSVGFRIEHLRSAIDKSQFGSYANHKNLSAASYKLSYHTKNNRGVYTFCMCPGGQVVCAASEQNMVVTNGMSNYKRDDTNSNSAVLVSVNSDDFKNTHPLAGVNFQRKLEHKAFVLGGENYNAPVQKALDFINNKPTTTFGEVIPSYKPGVQFANLSQIFPENLNESLKEGLLGMDKKIKGFVYSDAVLTGVESRSSSPVRILRDNDTYKAVNLNGLYPIGEGAGYAGGIMSAAVDALKCTERF